MDEISQIMLDEEREFIYGELPMEPFQTALWIYQHPCHNNLFASCLPVDEGCMDCGLAGRLVVSGYDH